MASLTDSVFALASGAGRSAVAVVRLSGPRTAETIRALAGVLPEPRRASLRRLRGLDGESVLDEALVLWFPAPRSYTGEDAGELHLHGGPAVVAAVADALIGLGCRPAEPGEFTRRAFLNGRLDLTQAEAIADLIEAETEAQRRQALRQADGALRMLSDRWQAEALALLAWQEAAIEFAMDDLPTDLDARARERAEALIAELRLHLADDRRGERLRSGVTIAILGAPNAGKSALFNALLGRDAAIVSARPGTTRDVLEGRLVLGGVVATLCDTAGVRAAEDEIEAEGVRRTLARAEEADLVLAVVASDAAPDRALLARLEEAKPPALVVASKADLGPPADAVRRFSPVPVSALTGAGLSALRDALAARLRSLAEAGEAGGLTRPRHRAAVVDAAAGLEEAIAARLPEVAAEGYRAAALAFGRLTGAVAVEAVLDRIFADFCIGK